MDVTAGGGALVLKYLGAVVRRGPSRPVCFQCNLRPCQRLSRALEQALDYGRGGNLPYRSGTFRLTERNARTRLDADDVEGQGQGRRLVLNEPTDLPEGAEVE